VVKRRKNGKNGEEKRIGGERRERKSRDERLKRHREKKVLLYGNQ
jgi:hypothetical protein